MPEQSAAVPRLSCASPQLQLQMTVPLHTRQLTNTCILPNVGRPRTCASPRLHFSGAPTSRTTLSSRKITGSCPKLYFSHNYTSQQPPLPHNCTSLRLHSSHGCTSSPLQSKTMNKHSPRPPHFNCANLIKGSTTKPWDAERRNKLFIFCFLSGNPSPPRTIMITKCTHVKGVKLMSLDIRTKSYRVSTSDIVRLTTEI